MNPIRVAIVEDNLYLREGLMQLINGTQGYKCVGAFADATDILHNIKRVEPQVVLMDIDLPSKMDGVDATFQIKETFPAIFIIIQTVFEDKTKIFQAIKAGASGYLLKNTPPAKLLEAIQDVVSGGSPMTPSIAYKALEMFRQANIPTPQDKKPPSPKGVLGTVSQLTERQNEILESIVKGKSYKMIAEELFISVDTVKFHVKNIYEIMQVHSRFELINQFKK
jgi:DNA-binding NarL/FixJ family response regulator